MSSPKLPFLPGYTFELDLKKNHHKSQLFAVSSGVRMVDVQYGAQKAAVSDALTSSIKLGDDVTVSPILDAKDLKAAQATGLIDKEAPASPSAGPFSSVEAQPSWLANDRKVLRFTAYFQEPVYASPTENFRVRPVIIYYYLADDTMHIAEPRSDNSGIPQGVLVKRHRFPKGSQGDLYKPTDLQVGAELEIYGRVYRIIDADPFTRETMKEKLGLELGAGESLPEDPHTALQAGKERSSFNKMMSPQKEFMEATLGRAMGISIDDTKRFLSNDRKVLRFYAVWEDPANNNEKRKYILHYFLADDTVEVKEIQQVNSGRDPMPVLLKRSKLPREYGSTAANVATIGVHADEDKSAFYSAAELRVGKTVNVFGRNLLLSSCDKYTQDYYSANYGLTTADFAALDISDPPKDTPTMEIPPYTGYGTEEDSLGSFTHLVPKPPRKDTKKLMDLDGKNLRYSAKFSSPKEDDKGRSFIVTFFMADDTVSIFERLERNSGFVGGKFLERSRIKDAKTGAYLAPKDFYVGAQLTINNFGFTLLSADEYTLKFMEANPSLYPFADPIQVLGELKAIGAPALSSAFGAVDASKSGSVSGDQLSSVLSAKGLNAHQILALSRTFSSDGKQFSYKQMLKSMEELA